MDEPISGAINQLALQLTALNTNYTAMCRDIGDIKALLEKQNGRVRELEVHHAERNIQIETLKQDVANLQKESSSRSSALWNGFNTIAAFVATYLALRS